MGTKAILTNGVGTVTFLFAAFGDYLLNIAPPEQTNSSFATGMGSIMVLFLLLLLKALTRNERPEKIKRIWLSVSLACFLVALSSCIYYKINLDTLTFSYPPEKKTAQFIAGTELTADAEAYRRDHPKKTVSEIVAVFEGPAFVERVWSTQSIRRSKVILTVNYLVLVISTATMLFALTEGVLMSPKDKE